MKGSVTLVWGEAYDTCFDVRYFEAGASCGLRIKSEGSTLMRDSADLSCGILILGTAFRRMHERREVPLNAVRTAFETGRRNAKLSGVRPHTLLDTFAGCLDENEASQKTVMELCGEKSSEMSADHTHVCEE